MGKASIIYVMGLGILMGYVLLNINASSTDAVTNFTTYYGRTMAHNIASSGANIGCSATFFKPEYETPFTDVEMLGGTMNVTFSVAGNRKFVTSIARLDLGPQVIIDTVIAELRNTSLARYAWFTNNEANRHGQPTSWGTSDTAWGVAHTNDKFNILPSEKPVFMKKATAWEAAVAKKNGALWLGGYQWGIYIPYPTNLTSFITAATAVQGRVINGEDASVEFGYGGSGKVRLKVEDLSIDTVFNSVEEFTANGAFAVIGGNLKVKGILVGDLAIGAIKNLGQGGTVYITGDIRYKTDPRLFPNSTDKLAIYAVDSINVTYDNSEPSKYYNRKVDASLFSLTGEFNVAEHNNMPYGPRGTLTTYGAMMQYYRGGIGVIVGGSLKAGYLKNFQYDERLFKKPPKYYPAMGRYTLYAWKEN